ncbi:hypothetical protein [Crossiella cryophila]|uniref:Uncharacterized protein n=1 Tax=Crossiella cryophila TaxID=43355 RepID=A0A7W7C455_9PSEU|nr:hypothetical protein [Crossiella cryophila]MBB4674217.1 hypothetical protein [Crossiella cryophila]
MTTGDRALGRMLPVRAELAAILPGGGLRRGSTVAVRGSTALLLGLLSTATAAGSWAAVVGLPGLGLAAAAEAGVAVQRLALVPRPRRESAAVTAALLDGLDLVVLANPTALAPAQARKLEVRARHRGSVLLAFGTWPGADLQLSCVDTRWHGLENGHGQLTRSDLLIEVTGRRAAPRPHRDWLSLEGPGTPPPDEFGEVGLAPASAAAVDAATGRTPAVGVATRRAAVRSVPAAGTAARRAAAENVPAVGAAARDTAARSVPTAGTARGAVAGSVSAVGAARSAAAGSVPAASGPAVGAARVRVAARNAVAVGVPAVRVAAADAAPPGAVPVGAAPPGTVAVGAAMPGVVAMSAAAARVADVGVAADVALTG